ncbi:transcriptional regulator with XRE-family HTH domain [Streptomyces sp. B3I7]|nr:transcriptional regulator with XRE-family HTH domain [Streptomyces sp. B3I7]
MPNERLRAVMAAGGWTYAALAQQVEVDPKSVERWVNLGRIPRRATALQAAKALGEDVHALWPALRQARPARAISPELVALYEQRADLPVSTFTDLMAQARERIDILVYAAVFLHEAYPRLNELLTERAAEGCTVRIAIGDPDSDNVQARGQEERFGHGIESRCRLALMHYKPFADTPGIEVRTHATTLYNSLYRADDQQLVNAHVWGVNAYAAPVWHLRDTRQAACSTPTPTASTPCGRRQPPYERKADRGPHRVLRRPERPQAEQHGRRRVRRRHRRPRAHPPLAPP